jgi:hypothetical protein
MQPALSLPQRLKLIETLCALPQTQFDNLSFALKPPPGVIPAASTNQSSRAKAMLDWVESPVGCGLSPFLETLELAAPGAFVLESFAAELPESCRIFLSYKRGVAWMSRWRWISTMPSAAAHRLH